MNDILKPYGLVMDATGQIHDESGKPLSARIEQRRGRIRVLGHRGKLLYSCPSPQGLEHFVETYWYREKRRQPAYKDKP